MNALSLNFGCNFQDEYSELALRLNSARRRKRSNSWIVCQT